MVMIEARPPGPEEIAAASGLRAFVVANNLEGDVRQRNGAPGIPLTTREQAIFVLGQSHYSATTPQGEHLGQSVRFMARETGGLDVYTIDPSDYPNETSLGWQEFHISSEGVVRRVLKGWPEKEDAYKFFRRSTRDAVLETEKALTVLKTLQAVAERGRGMVAAKDPELFRPR